MEIFSAVTLCCESVVILGPYGIVLFIIVYILLLMAGLLAFPYLMRRFNNEGWYFKKHNLLIASILGLAEFLMIAAVSYFITRGMFYKAEVLSEGAANVILAKKLSNYPECLDSAVLSGASPKDFSASVLLNYDGMRPEIYGELERRYLNGVDGFSVDPTKATEMRGKKVVFEEMCSSSMFMHRCAPEVTEVFNKIHREVPKEYLVLKNPTSLTELVEASCKYYHIKRMESHSVKN